MSVLSRILGRPWLAAILTGFILATSGCISTGTKDQTNPLEHVTLLDGENVRLLEDAGRHTWVKDGHTNTVYVQDGVPLYVVTGDGLLYLMGIDPRGQ